MSKAVKIKVAIATFILGVSAVALFLRVINGAEWVQVITTIGGLWGLGESVFAAVKAKKTGGNC